MRSPCSMSSARRAGPWPGKSSIHGIISARSECMVVHLLDNGTGQHARHQNTELRADMLRHQFVISGDDLDADMIDGKFGQRRFGARLRRTEQDGFPKWTPLPSAPSPAL